MTFGFSRDDVGKFLRIYQDKKILEKDPFASIDVEGVGSARHAWASARTADAARPEARYLRRARRRSASFDFFEKIGLDYVSASPYRIPVARLAAAQAALAVKVGD